MFNKIIYLHTTHNIVYLYNPSTFKCNNIIQFSLKKIKIKLKYIFLFLLELTKLLHLCNILAQIKLIDSTLKKKNGQKIVWYLK